MKAPDSLKILINDLLDKHWEDIIQGKDFNETEYDPSTNICKVKVQMSLESTKLPVDRYIIRIITKWFM